jgi:hypothetical protein
LFNTRWYGGRKIRSERKRDPHAYVRMGVPMRFVPSVALRRSLQWEGEKVKRASKRGGPGQAAALGSTRKNCKVPCLASHFPYLASHFPCLVSHSHVHLMAADHLIENVPLSPTPTHPTWLKNISQNVVTLSRHWQSVRSFVTSKRSCAMFPSTLSRSFRLLLSPLHLKRAMSFPTAMVRSSPLVTSGKVFCQPLWTQSNVIQIPCA